MTKQQKSTYKTLYFMCDELVCYMNIITASGNSTASISCILGGLCKSSDDFSFKTINRE